MNPATPKQKDNAIEPVLYMALELSNKTWKVVFGDGVRRRRVSVEAGSLKQLQAGLSEAKSRFELEADSRVMSCYEAGRDGFWLHRYLTSLVLVMEFFVWRNFRNRREVGALAGLTGTPYNSGESEQDQGISKAGNRRVRSMMVEITWLWLRYQPESALSRWYEQRFAGGGRRY